MVRRVLDVSVMKSQLEGERRKLMDDNPALNILGPSMVCPDTVITDICTSSAKYISVLEDMDLFSLRNELKECFFNVVVKNCS